MTTLLSTFTCAKPPRACPTRVFAKPTIRSAIPLWDMTTPARMKRGTANSGNDSIPPSNCWTTMKGFIPGVTRKYTIAVERIANATGTPSSNSTSNRPNSSSVIMA